MDEFFINRKIFEFVGRREDETLGRSKASRGSNERDRGVIGGEGIEEGVNACSEGLEGGFRN